MWTAVWFGALSLAACGDGSSTSAADSDSGSDDALDSDGDGFGDAALGGTDCDDTDPQIHPGAPEHCDGHRNDCDDAGWTEDLGVVSLERTDGSWQALTGEWTASVSHNITEDGTVWICPGDWEVSLTLAADLALVGVGGAELTTLDAGGIGPVIRIERDGLDVRLSGLTLTGGEGIPFLVSDHHPDEYDAGGGVHCNADAALALEAVVVRENSAVLGAGALLSGCDADILQSRFEDNTSERHGGGVYLDGDSLSRFSDTDFLRNHAGFSAGAVHLNQATVTIEGGRFEANSANSGGALMVSGGEVTVRGADFAGNSAVEFGGGAIDLFTGTLWVEDTTFTDNSANTSPDGELEGRDGGAVKLSWAYPAHFSGAVFTGNAAYSGGAISADGGTLDIIDSEFRENTALELGGGVALEGSNLTVTDSLFQGNEDDGIWLYDDATADINDCGFYDHGAYDVRVGASAGSQWDDVVTATCDSEGCVE